jgi:hypothetical protein
MLIWGGSAALLSHRAFGLDPDARIWLRVIGAGLGMAWTVAFAALAFRAQDEFTQEASKFAWYWGGAIGAAASAPVYTFIAFGGLRLLGFTSSLPRAANLALFHAFALGYSLLAVSLILGFGIARLWWSLSRR